MFSSRWVLMARKGRQFLLSVDIIPVEEWQLSGALLSLAAGHNINLEAPNYDIRETEIQANKFKGCRCTDCHDRDCGQSTI